MPEGLWPVLWQGALLAPLLLSLAVAGDIAWYRLTWARRPRWREAWRHAHSPRIWLDRWVYFRWIHYDCQYWVLPVRLDRGPLTLVGRPPDAPYWSLTWYATTEAHASLSSEQVSLDEAGQYHLRIGGPPAERDWIAADPGARRAVLYLRVYEPVHAWPIPLPTVHQGGRLLAAGGDR